MPRALMHAGDGMRESAHPQMGNASTSMSAQAAREDTKSPLAPVESERDWELLEGRGRFERKSEKGSDWEERDVGFTPKYKRGFVFSDSDTGNSRAAGCMEFELLVPRPPAKEFENAEAIKTIEDHHRLFKITTPIKVDVLENYLEMHPNQDFVWSVAMALREGFWPWADTCPEEGFPVTWDNVRMNPQSAMERKFICRYRDEEIAAERFSEPFGPDLLPGMYSTPVHAVPKPHSDDFRSRLDSLHTLFSVILWYRQKDLANAHKTLVVFKSDVSKAYRLCPMHPLWQLKQVVTTGYLTRRVWYSINGLITWVAINIENIEDLCCYVDDDFGFDEWNDLDFYEPYDSFYSLKQTKLLRLWDRLGVPHSKPKQLFGLQLVIIGFDVDPNAMTATMPTNSKAELVQALQYFASSNRRNLQEYQQIAGWSNWAFNMFPLLKPGLCNVYAKMQGKTNPFAGIALNNVVKGDLKWLADHIEKSDGVCCFDSTNWDLILDATITVLCDACLNGMGFWIPKIACSFVCPTPALPEGEEVIFFFEALCVCAAIHWVAETLSPELRKRVTIFMDNMNTVDIFNSLRALPTYNPILKAAVDVMISHSIDLHVIHIPGPDNKIVDALSRSLFLKARKLVPCLLILSFKPPHEVLGASGC
ncbi:hypothetical protein ARMGADRAFT_1088068 [Armillaria gallica]|uniref:DNA/RNA polymerase n=1 Tax=Armillaria gallica TaxID=47427 RepID=A0A2H3CPB9_ARMGA|nr:hypothetical protein ARMGADRAFT_1088068 [Armillaria gallica]